MSKICMQEERLVDYLEGHLSGIEKMDVEKHLSHCDICLECLTVAGLVLQRSNENSVVPVPEEVVERTVDLVRGATKASPFHWILYSIKSFLASLKASLPELWSWARPSLSSVRGGRALISDDMVLVRRVVNGCELEIEVEKRGEAEATIRVIMINNYESKPPIRVTLSNKGREVASYLLQGGLATFENIPFERYSLEFFQNGEKTGEYLFEIKEKLHGRKPE